MRCNQHLWFRLYPLLGITLLGLLGAVLVSPIPQDQAYHNFADQRNILGVPNFWNVATNIPFVLVGIMGIRSLIQNSLPALLPGIFHFYLVFFGGVSLVGLGSGYYHLWPSNETLVWDRLPMAITFMAFFAIVISEFISEKFGKWVFLPLLLLGAISVGYWNITELRGEGDLRPYALVQFLPMLLIPVILLSFTPRFSHISLIWALLATYLFAKGAEMGDKSLYKILEGLSGHSIKHLFSALGPYFFFLALKKRGPFKRADSH